MNIILQQLKIFTIIVLIFYLFIINHKKLQNLFFQTLYNISFFFNLLNLKALISNTKNEFFLENQLVYLKDLPIDHFYFSQYARIIGYFTMKCSIFLSFIQE